MFLLSQRLSAVLGNQIFLFKDWLCLRLAAANGQKLVLDAGADGYRYRGSENSCLSPVLSPHLHTPETCLRQPAVQRSVLACTFGQVLLVDHYVHRGEHNEIRYSHLPEGSLNNLVQIAGGLQQVQHPGSTCGESVPRPLRRQWITDFHGIRSIVALNCAINKGNYPLTSSRRVIMNLGRGGEMADAPVCSGAEQNAMFGLRSKPVPVWA